MAPLRILGRPPKQLRALMSGALFLILAVAVVCGPLQAGARYFYCEALGLSSSDPCTQGAEHQAPCPFESLDRQALDCCKVITLSSVPDGARASEPTVPVASVVAVLPAVRDGVASSGREDLRPARASERWRKPPRTSSERRAELMVFLT